MDINLIRSIVTVAAFVAFLGIVWWAYAPAHRERMEQAGRSVLEEQDQ
jgi:cytochrome c oxidase cbb3-type subunit IV